MFLQKTVLLLLLWLVAFNNSKAQDTTCAINCACGFRPDFHAPIGVMLDHAHNKGQWMFSYRYMNMAMKDNMTGTTSINSDGVFQSYIMSPNTMQMQMHMLMLMVGITNKITIMGMANYTVNDMSMTMSMYGMMGGMSMNHSAMGSRNSSMIMNDRSNGISDSKLYLLYRLIQHQNHEVLLSNGLNIPTGNISVHGIAMGQDQRKSYSMQLGSGTYAWMPGLTYTGFKPHVSWGFQASGIINIGTNANNYCLGNTFNSTAWLSYKWINWLSSSVRIEENLVGKIAGFDAKISPYRTTDPMANSKNYGSNKFNMLVGLNFLIPKGVLKGNQFCVEYGVPVYQQVNGIQMKSTQLLFAGWQLAF